MWRGDPRSHTRDPSRQRFPQKRYRESGLGTLGNMNAIREIPDRLLRPRAGTNRTTVILGRRLAFAADRLNFFQIA